jgi:O-antigen/teichoic acid export membrane protein
MSKLGISMTIAGFLASLSTYVLNAFISHAGNIDQVGLYNAGWGLVGQATGLVFTAMATDYFPRLAACTDNMNKVREQVNQQAETAILIMNPLLIILIVSMPIIVRILYTPEFLPVVMFANLLVLGNPIKVISWSMGYIYLAKGDGRLFLFVEIAANLVVLLFNLLGYYLYGLEGLGVSFILTNILGATINHIIVGKKYNFRLSSNFMRTFLVSYMICFASFITFFISNEILKYVTIAIIAILGILHSLFALDKVMDLKAIIKDLIDRFFSRNKM